MNFKNSFSNNVFSHLNCALMKANSYEHLCVDPLKLSCGHFICQKCHESTRTDEGIKCKTCFERNRNDLNVKSKAEMFNFILENHMKELFQISLDYYESNFTSFKRFKSIANGTIDTSVASVRDKIKQRIEKIRDDLDKLNKSFDDDLDDLKQVWLFDYENVGLNEFDEMGYEQELKSLEEKLQKGNELSTSELYYYQSRIEAVQKINDRLRGFIDELKFEGSKRSIDESIVGEIRFNSEFNKRLLERIKAGGYQKVDFDECIVKMVSLTNNCLIGVDINGYLLVYDQNFKVLKRTNEINKKKVEITCMADGGVHGQIYLFDAKSKSLIKTDLELNKLAEVEVQEHLEKSTGMCFCNEFVYLCDNNNKMIQKFDSNLHYITKYELEFNPIEIINMRNIAIIKSDETKLYFYNLIDFNKITAFKCHNNIGIGVANNQFYELERKRLSFYKFYCYSANGKLVEAIEICNDATLNCIDKHCSIVLNKFKLYLVSDSGHHFLI